MSDHWELRIEWVPEYREHRYEWRRNGVLALHGYVSGRNNQAGRSDTRRVANHARTEHVAKSAGIRAQQVSA